MTNLHQIGVELDKLNAASAAAFGVTAQALQPQIEPAELDAWAVVCLKIAGSGWHGWEATNLYLALSLGLRTAGGSELLLGVGRYGSALSGFSIDPCVSYFRGVETLVNHASIDLLPAIERTGVTLTSKYTHAANLVADYFKTAFAVALQASESELSHWLKIADKVVRLERADILQLLALSHSAPRVSWEITGQLYEQVPVAAFDYLRCHEQLANTLSRDQLQRLTQRLLVYVKGDHAVTGWLASLTTVLPALAHKERDNLLQMLEQLQDVRLAETLVETVPNLPMADWRILDTWLSGVFAFGARQHETAMAYLSLESARSVESLAALQGQLQLADCQRLLQFYTEAFVGARLRLISREDPEARGQHLAGTDGTVIVLPELAADYATSAENFRFYKAALLHQLGFYEFGTFDFQYEANPLAFTAYFRRFNHPALAGVLFQLLEDARVDWQLAHAFRGSRADFVWLKQDALLRRESVIIATETGLCLEAIVRTGIDAEWQPELLLPTTREIRSVTQTLQIPGASVWDTMAAVRDCYGLIVRLSPSADEADCWLEMPQQVNFRGVMEPDTVRVNLQLGLLADEDLDLVDDDAEKMGMSMMLNPGDIDVDKMKQAELEGAGMLLKEMDRLPDEMSEQSKKEAAADENTMKALLEARAAPQRAREFQYDEWDFVINDYRRRWCTLYEIREVDEDPTFVDEALQSLRGLGSRVRRQLNMLRPEMLAKVRGQFDGEELDMEKAIEAIVDRKAGLSPEDRIYVQRQRKLRDVSALFLLDMSASTDDPVPDPDAVVVEPVLVDPDSHDYLRDYYEANPPLVSARTKRIIDLEKEAAILMAEALQDLGDNYAICGFSGYGREQVEYFVHKDFTDTYNRKVKDKIGGIKPCRSTRMGPAIRHATQQLMKTESRIKALIILSDGYPQDFDYGKDRNSREYGVKDTTRALAEARQQGISAFCLTVDPSGHDYLREMCPDQQYMVIQDINDLPGELSKVYRGLTA
jgi:nitric oxide reductase NorD protein